MQTETEIQKAAQRGIDAKALLESPLLAESFGRLKQTYIDQLMATDVTQSELRDRCWLAARVVDVVRDHLTKVVNDGVVAQSDLDRLAKEAQRKKRFGL